MFTGIIEATGSVASLQNIDSEWRLVVATGKIDLDDVCIGDSISVNGCCLTVVELEKERFSADVSNETMSCTTLGSLQVGSAVNLEKAMLATSRFGGHIVSGHIDGVGVLGSSSADGKSVRLQFDAPDELAKYIAAKGSICIDGTSLTVNEVHGVTFTINVIPHTQEETVIGDYVTGQRVNLEVDLVARYIERLMHSSSAANTDASVIDADFLKEHGFKSA
jgi:riboflavin synthase